MNLTLHIWRQRNASEKGRMVRYDLPDVNPAPVFYIGFITNARKLDINDHLDVAGPEEGPRRHGRGLRGLLAFPGGAL